MTQNNLNSEIGRIVNDWRDNIVLDDEVRIRLENDLRLIAEKTVEAVRVEENNDYDSGRNSDPELEYWEHGYNKAIHEQNTKSRAWLGKE